MGAKHNRTKDRIFEKPTRADVEWREVEALLESLGAEIDYGRKGSRVAVSLRGRKAIFHKPHPQKEIGKRMLEDVRDFLAEAGVS